MVAAAVLTAVARYLTLTQRQSPIESAFEVIQAILSFTNEEYYMFLYFALLLYLEENENYALDMNIFLSILATIGRQRIEHV